MYNSKEDSRGNYSPKKSLGQHWLFDEASLEAMVRAGKVTKEDTVLEVGPGLGTLTKKLCKNAKQVIAVELDNELAAGLRQNLSLSQPERSKAKPNDHSDFNQTLQARDNTEDNLNIFNQNILEFDTTTLPKNYKVIANIPYYLTSNLIRVLLEAQNPPQIMALLIQKEVAQRITATPGEMSILAVATQFYAEVELKELIPAELFTPPPKVDSQIIQIRRRTQPLFPDIDTNKFFALVRAGFSEKRKKLRSSLSGGLHIPKEQVDELLRKANITPDARAQELTLNQWYHLYKNV